MHQQASGSGASPRVLDSLPICQYRMTSYDEENTRSDVSPAYGIHLHDPRLLEYVRASELARLFSRTPKYWLHHMGREKTLAAALQLQHDVGLIMSNIQVLGQFVTSLNQMASEVMRVAFDREPFPSEAVQYVTPSHRVRRAAHYMAAMGLWHFISPIGVCFRIGFCGRATVPVLIEPGPLLRFTSTRAQRVSQFACGACDLL